MLDFHRSGHNYYMYVHVCMDGQIPRHIMSGQVVLACRKDCTCGAEMYLHLLTKITKFEEIFL